MNLNKSITTFFSDRIRLVLLLIIFQAGLVFLKKSYAQEVNKSLAQQKMNPPPGFTAMFNGYNLNGWRGRPGSGGVFSPYTEARFTKAERDSIQTEWNLDRDAHWSVRDGVIVSDGHGVYLATSDYYANFELWVDWRFAEPNGDSGIYLRSYPQVQLWDPNNPAEKKNKNHLGSGGLFNNNDNNPGKWPLVKADKPTGEWNSLKVKMVGDRVWVVLNEKTTVNGQIMDNFFDRNLPLLPSGSIELQTHGARTEFKNLFIREIGAKEAKRILAQLSDESKQKNIP